jgi:hypothetical protein
MGGTPSKGPGLQGVRQTRQRLAWPDVGHPLSEGL